MEQIALPVKNDILAAEEAKENPSTISDLPTTALEN